MKPPLYRTLCVLCWSIGPAVWVWLLYLVIKDPG